MSAILLSSFPGGSISKESVCNVGDLGLIPGSERPLGEGKGNPLQYSCWESPMDRRAWQATVHGVARVGHNLATELNMPYMKFNSRLIMDLNTKLLFLAYRKQ